MKAPSPPSQSRKTVQPMGADLTDQNHEKNLPNPKRKYDNNWMLSEIDFEQQ